MLEVKPIVFLIKIHHAYTHFTLTEFVWRCELVDEIEGEALKWVPLSELGNYPMGKVDRAIAVKISTDE
jgi:hypothetical protein